MKLPSISDTLNNLLAFGKKVAYFIIDHFRPKKDKVFVLSLHRCGTTNTHQLLGQLGYRSIHWPVRDGKKDIQNLISGRETDIDYLWSCLLPLTKRFDAFADVPIQLIFQQAAKEYPNAKFILFHRSPESWIKSVRKHMKGTDFRPYERALYWKYCPDKPGSINQLSDETLTTMAQNHRAEVEKFFSDSDRLLSLSLEDPEAGDKICAFLGVEGSIELPKPRKNRPTS